VPKSHVEWLLSSLEQYKDAIPTLDELKAFYTGWHQFDSVQQREIFEALFNYTLMLQRGIGMLSE
jgi:hypothetical protein